MEERIQQRRRRRNRYWYKVALVSIASSAGLFVCAGALVWSQRERIARAFVASIPSVPAPMLLDFPNEVPAEIMPVISPSVISVVEEPVVPKVLTVTEVVAAANPSVISIEVATTNVLGIKRTTGGGSGFFVTSDGLIVTNRHVVSSTQNITLTVVTSNGTKYPATIVAQDPVLDIAFIRIAGSGFQAATLGDSDTLELGQSVLAIGYALGKFENSISVGVISGLSRSITAGDGNGSSEYLDKVIQTDAAINPGNSGGPLLDLSGNVIGVSVAVAQGSQSIGFALPINSVRQAIDSVKRNGIIVRPYVGIRYDVLTPAGAKAFGLPVEYGILVGSGSSLEPAVLPGSPAEKAGIRAGDIITSIDGRKLDSESSFASIIRQKSVGSRVSLVIYRNRVSSTLSLILAQAPL